MGDTIQIDTRKLDDFIKMLKGKAPVARVGILGDKNARSGKGGENAAIGAAHEYGSAKKNLPVRSFLRIPIAENLQKYLEKSNAFDRAAFAKVIQQGSMREWVKKVGIVAEGIVADAFASGGFGKWQPSDMSKKKVLQTLVETTQLRNSITSDVK